MHLLKKLINLSPSLKSFLIRIKAFFGIRVKNFLRRSRLRVECYFSDIVNDVKYLNWRRNESNYWKLSSELIFYYHKLEKGLSLPSDARKWFGKYAAEKTLLLMDEWNEYGLSKDKPVYQASCAVLYSYHQHLCEIEPKTAEINNLISKLEVYSNASSFSAQYSTPIPLVQPANNSFETLESIALSRRSTRSFSGKLVDLRLIEKAAAIAQLSPSACNRQPWKLHIYDDKEDIKNMLSLQNGNRGFGHTVPMLAVISSDLTGFFDSSERFEPTLDGGLFLMSFLLALQSLGLASCCLNWCVDPSTDKQGHKVGRIPNNERILTFLAIGYPEEDAVVCLSARRPLSDLLIKH